MQARALAAALVLLTALFIGFSWWVYVASDGKMHWAIPVLCTALPLLIALTTYVLQRLAALRGAQGLENALAADGARQLQRQASSVRSAEVDRLRNEFERAVGALKGSKLGRGQGSAREALYRLPWYTIIGPPACGKTTVLRNSGLKFPHLAGTGDRLKGIGGTRNCDWWLTNQAILLDTAGRWTLEDDDRDEWFAFLDLLKRHRSERPLNGVIAAISLAGDDATSLASVDIQGVKLLAGRMRERLDEITGRLGLELPVYLLFTKCDLISGFVETFGEMGPQERRQIWGFTAPILAERSSSPGAYFGEQFDVLCRSLDNYSLVRMGEEVRPDIIARVFEFPAQLRQLQDKLTAFVDELFEESAYGESPFLRGAYFTSGTQEGAPADLLFEEMAQAMNVRPPEQELEGEKKSYFLHDMLMNVVFEDRHMATASHAELMRQQKRRRVWTSGLFVGASLVAVLPTLSCQHNLSALSRTRALLSDVQGGSAPDANASAPTRVADLLAIDEEVARYEQGMPTLMAGFGLYQGDDLREPLTRYQGAALKEWALRPLMNKSNEKLIAITQQLEGLRMQGHGNPPLDETSRAELQDALKLHLLLTVPREECVPKPMARKEWVVQRLLDVWERSAPSKDRAELLQRRSLLVSYLERLSSQGDELALGKDRRRVELARAALGGEDKVGQLLHAMMDRFGKDPADFSRLAGASSIYVGGQPVHGAFTLDAWRQTSRELSSTKQWSISDESWVLGCGQSSDDELRAAQHSAEFQREYLERYEEHWRRFIDGISARAPSNAVEAETMLAELVGRPGVLGNLFQRLKENTDLPPPPPNLKQAAGALAEQALESAKGKAAAAVGLAGSTGGTTPATSPELDKLRKAFEELASFGVAPAGGGEPPLEQYRRHVEAVLMALKAYRNDESKIDALAVAAKTAVDNVELLLSSRPSNWTARLRELLVPPLAGVLNITSHDRGGQIQRLWCQLVYRPFQEELAGRYPMQVDSTSSSSLQAFQRFLQPGSGLVWAFQSGQLQAYVSQEGDHFRFNNQAGGEGRGLLRDELITFLNRALEVRRAFFPDGSATMRVPFRFRVRGAAGYSVTSFSVGSKAVRYDSGAEVWTNAEWPGEQPSLGATLTVTPYQGVGPKPLTLGGEWGLFMILDERLGHGHILERADRQFTAGWKPKGSQNWVKIDFAADDARSPLLAVPFGRQARNLLPLSVPARITHAGGGC